MLFSHLADGVARAGLYRTTGGAWIARADEGKRKDRARRLHFRLRGVTLYIYKYIFLESILALLCFA